MLRIDNFSLLLLALVLGSIAAFCDHVTLAPRPGAYTVILGVGLGSLIACEAVCIVAFLRTGPLRWFAAMIGLASLFICGDLPMRFFMAIARGI
jgi:alpha-beta hydrolase superfamily lysophospholipase